ncbi:MAG: hypothetical protein HYY50_05275 [Candidatus Kerfeldbacteria bacterium]|nr:hypothetical protein [Candidatus Kerfeldbacteria bacterium]
MGQDATLMLGASQDLLRQATGKTDPREVIGRVCGFRKAGNVVCYSTVTGIEFTGRGECILHVAQRRAFGSVLWGLGYTQNDQQWRAVYDGARYERVLLEIL